MYKCVRHTDTRRQPAHLIDCRAIETCETAPDCKNERRGRAHGERMGSVLHMCMIARTRTHGQHVHVSLCVCVCVSQLHTPMARSPPGLGGVEVYCYDSPHARTEIHPSYTLCLQLLQARTHTHIVGTHSTQMSYRYTLQGWRRICVPLFMLYVLL